MKNIVFSTIVLTLALSFVHSARAQADDICGEFGFMPTLDAPRLSAPYLYGKIRLTGVDASAKLPKVTVIYANRGQSPERITVGRSGSYCFRVSGGQGGNLVIELDGSEIERRVVPNFGTAQQREDFEINISNPAASAGAAVISSKFSYPPNERTKELYQQASAAEREKKHKDAAKLMTQVVEIDEGDFIAWAYLGTLYFEQKDLANADAAYRKALEKNPEYTPAWVNVGKLRIAQKQYEAAVEILKHAASLEPESAPIYQALGEAYLLNKQGTLGAQALNHAIRLDPVGMAEVHLQLAHLFQLAKANNMAAAEYKKFLEKRPEHPDRKKFEKFIKDNPPE